MVDSIIFEKLLNQVSPNAVWHPQKCIHDIRDQIARPMRVDFPFSLLRSKLRDVEYGGHGVLIGMTIRQDRNSPEVFPRSKSAT